MKQKNKNQQKNSNETKGWFFENTNKTDKSFIGLKEKNREDSNY